MSRATLPPPPDFPLLVGLDVAERSALLARLPCRRFAAGETMLDEGAANQSILLVESGEVSVRRGDFAVARLGPGDCVGEMSAVAGGGATATVRAESVVAALSLRLDDLPPAHREPVQLALTRILIARLANATAEARRRHDESVGAMRTQLASAVYAGRMLTALCFYVLISPLHALLKLHLASDSLISAFIIALFFALAWNFVTRLSGGFADYGMTRDDWGRKVRRCLALTAPLFAGALVAKLVFLRYAPAHRLFEPWLVLADIPQAGWVHWTCFVAGYVVLALAQEFVRCAMQGSLAGYFRAGGVDDRWRAVLVSSLVFSATHIHLSPWFSLIAFPAGLFWGWLYQREKSYWGVAVSHAAIGVWSVFVLGVPY